MIHPHWVMYLEEEKKHNKQKVDSLLGYTTNYEEKDLYAIDSFLMENYEKVRQTGHFSNTISTFGLYVGMMLEKQFIYSQWESPEGFAPGSLSSLILHVSTKDSRYARVKPFFRIINRINHPEKCTVSELYSTLSRI